MSDVPQADDLGRPAITETMKAQIAQAFTVVPPNRRGALLFIADETGVVRMHVAARIGSSWKVAAGGGYEIGARRPSGFVGVEAAW